MKRGSQGGAAQTRQVQPPRGPGEQLARELLYVHSRRCTAPAVALSKGMPDRADQEPLPVVCTHRILATSRGGSSWSGTR
ncbi:hypothetical protein [Streptomyces sp. NPDC007991]|uniref:hypothetical protein n=1 Tax=Streptomyces sp. NPDC007991 TaxID=3364803 RepID=UPI0036E32000